MWLVSLFACSSPPDPADAPQPQLVEIGVEARGLRVGDRILGPTIEMLGDPADGLHPPLIAALDGVQRVRARSAADTPWLLVRKLVNSAERAGVGHVELALAGGEAGGDTRWGPSRPVRGSWRPTCPEEPVRVVGVDPAWTLQIHRGPEGLWMLASARFRPLIEDPVQGAIPMEDLPPSCWGEVSCDVASGAGREACRSGEAGPPRVDVAGRWGCLLPIAKQPDGVDAWRGELATLLEGYGITAAHDVMLIPEATVPFGAVAAVLDAFARRDQPPPTLGQLLLEGNDGPPLCTIAVRDRDALDRAAGHWLAGALADR